MVIFMTIVIFFAGLFVWFCVLQCIVSAVVRKRQFSKLLEEVSGIFRQFRYTADITLFLGLFYSSNDDKAVEEVYLKPGNLEIAQKAVIRLWSGR